MSTCIVRCIRSDDGVFWGWVSVRGHVGGNGTGGRSQHMILGKAWICNGCELKRLSERHVAGRNMTEIFLEAAEVEIKSETEKITSRRKQVVARIRSQKPKGRQPAHSAG